MAPRQDSSGPDQPYSWVVAGACCWIYFFLFGVFRSAGFLYVSIVQTFDVTREEAAWPFSLCSTMLCVGGPVVAIMCHLVSIRSIVMASTLLICSGPALCFVANGVGFITACIGVIYGLGFSAILTCLPVIVIQYSVRHRATATAIASAGPAVSSFLFPILIHHLLEVYALRGTLLLLSGILMNTFVGAALLRPPGWLRSGTRPQKTDHHNNHYQMVQTPAPDAQPAELSENCIESQEAEDHKTEVIQEDVTSALMDEKIDVNGKTEVKDPDQDRREATRARWRGLLTIGSHPVFYLITLSLISTYMCQFTYFTVIVDFAMDRHTDSKTATLLLVIFSVGDLLGRLVLGWVSDRMFCRRRTIVLINLLIIGAVLEVMPLTWNFASLSCASFALGFVIAGTTVLFSVLMADYLGTTLMPIAMGVVMCLSGLLSTLRPVLIGYFRDMQGAYDGLFYTLGIISAVCGLLWLTEPIHVKRRPMAVNN